MPKKLLITIDGPSGAGKTTVSRILADRLGYTYVDTGALYRGVAYAAREAGVPAEDDQGLARVCGSLALGFVRGETGPRLLVNGKDVTDSIRSPEITMLSSAASARPVVRNFLLGLQKSMGQGGAAVFEGRDMGTVVFPEADVKFFLSADLEIRARRRYREMGQSAPSLDRVLSDMKRRDTNDSTRALAPLSAAEDAVRIDSTDLSIEQVVEAMLRVIREKAGFDGRHKEKTPG